MDNNVSMAEFKKGAKAGFAYAASENFDKDLFVKNCEKAGEWAESVNLEPTAGNVLVLSTMASFRTMLGDELYDTPIVDKEGEFCEEKMDQVKDKALAILGFRMNGDVVEEIHEEPTAE